METPTLTQVIQRHIKAAMWDTYTALPATVKAFDGGGPGKRPSATVQPFPADYAQGQPVPHPQLASVPVCDPGPARWELTPGDTVLVLFSSRSLERYRSGQGDGDPQDNERTHDLSDPWVLPLEGGNSCGYIGQGQPAARKTDPVDCGTMDIQSAGLVVTFTYTPPGGGIPQVTTLTFTGSVGVVAAPVGPGIGALSGVISDGSSKMEIDS